MNCRSGGTNALFLNVWCQREDQRLVSAASPMTHQEYNLAGVVKAGFTIAARKYSVLICNALHSAGTAGETHLCRKVCFLYPVDRMLSAIK